MVFPSTVNIKKCLYHFTRACRLQEEKVEVRRTAIKAAAGEGAVTGSGCWQSHSFLNCTSLLRMDCCTNQGEIFYSLKLRKVWDASGRRGQGSMLYNLSLLFSLCSTVINSAQLWKAVYCLDWVEWTYNDSRTYNTGTHWIPNIELQFGWKLMVL